MSKVKKQSEKTRFYMVCRDPREVRNNNPKSVLSTLEAARKHAENLVRDTGHTFYILASIAKAEPASPPVEWTVYE